MEDLLVIILQCVFEFLAEVFSYIGFDFVPEGRWQESSLTGKCWFWFVIGGMLAGISIMLFQRTWIAHPALRIANICLAPITSAFISQAIARYRSKRNRSVVPRNSFWQAFWFTFGVVLIRFIYAARH
jgi:hypothetical protein